MPLPILPLCPSGRLVMRGLRVLLATSLALVAVLSGFVVGPAAAGSSLNNPLNVLAATADAAEYARLAAELGVSASPEVAEYEARMAATATTATVGASTVGASPKAGGRIGMVLNTVAVLSGVAFLWPGGDSAPELPMPLPTTAATGYCAGKVWTTNPYVASVTCGGSSATFTMSTSAQGAYGSGQGMWGIRSGQSGLYDGDFSYPGPERLWSGSSTSWALGSIPVGVTTWALHRFNTSSLAVGANVGSGLAIGNLWTSSTGMANPQTGTEADPALVPRYIDSSINCKSPGGGFEVVTGRHGPFAFDPALPFTMPEVPDLECPDGMWLDSGTRVLDTPGTTEPDVPLQDPYNAPDWVEQQATDFPECFPIGSSMCQLKLHKLPLGTQPEYDCHAYAAGTGNPCLDWRTDPDRREKYECRFGGTPVALWKCNPYEDLWTTGVLTPTPEAEPEDPPVGVDPTPEQTPNLGDCTPNWSELLTPWWVFKAVSCSLKWAFVPQTALSIRIGAIRTALTGRVPFSWFAGFAAIPGAVPAGTCPDWRVEIPTPGPSGGSLLDENVVCDSSFTSAIRTARPVFLVFMGALALWPLIRSTAYAAFPIIKPSPGTLR